MSRLRGANIEEETLALLERKRLLEAVSDAERRYEPTLRAVSSILERGGPVGDLTLVAAALHKQLCNQVHQLPGRPKAAKVSELLHSRSDEWSIETCWVAASSIRRALQNQLRLITKPHSPLHAETFRVTTRDWIVLRASYDGIVRLARPP